MYFDLFFLRENASHHSFLDALYRRERNNACPNEQSANKRRADERRGGFENLNRRNKRSEGYARARFRHAGRGAF